MIHIIALMTENAFIKDTYFSAYYTKSGEGNKTPPFKPSSSGFSEVKIDLLDQQWEPRSNFITVDEIIIYNVARITAIFFDPEGNYVRHGVFQHQTV